MSSRRARHVSHRLVDVSRVPDSVLDCVLEARLKVHYRIDLPLVDFSNAVKKWKQKAES